MKPFVSPIYFLLLTFHFFTHQTNGQNPSAAPSTRQEINPSQFHINQFFNLGYGFDDISTGIITNDGSIVKLSPGGGIGIGLLVGYRVPINKLDFTCAGFFQISPMTPSISNGSGSFTRTVFEPMIKYILKVHRNGYINIGPGLNIAANGKADIDASQIPSGAHNIYSYKSATGVALAVEYQWLKKRIGLTGGFKYYSLHYRLESMTSDGFAIPIGVLPPELLKDVNKINGSGIDFYLGAGLYF